MAIRAEIESFHWREMKTVFAKDRFPTDWKASRNGYTLKVWNVPHNYTMIAIVLTVGLSHRSPILK